MNKIFAYAIALLVLVGLTATVLIVTGVIPSANKSSRSGIISGAPQIGGEFSLVNNKGKSVTEKDFQGKMMLVFFGYTFCPDVCPTEMQTFSQVMTELGVDAEEVIPVFITVDPARDTVEVMDEFVAAFHPSIVGLTGSEEQIIHVKKQYRAYGQKVEGEDKEYYLVDHTSFTYLMGKDGQLATVFSYGTTTDEMIKKIRELL
ncbi:MAG: SCO family protein [Sneathiella sp.]|nr:SCO family protein [Sneathiella sp.]